VPPIDQAAGSFDVQGPTMRNVQPSLLPAILMGVFLANPALAQETPRHVPLDHRRPAGAAARWYAIARPGIFGYPQPVRIELPGQGTVTYLDGTPDGKASVAPSQAALLVGHVYHVKLSGMPEFPGVELYPTIEVLDRLHPPEGLADEFPVPIAITVEEIETVLQDRMVTKVIYLEEPKLATPNTAVEGQHVTELEPHANLIEAAYQLGRPMAILRIGGRTPAPGAGDDFLRLPAPVVLPAKPAK
jgi:hypothetical protein